MQSILEFSLALKQQMAMYILNKENLMFPKGIDSGLVKVEEFLTKVLGIIIRCFSV